MIQETLEKATERICICERDITLFQIGAKWQEENSYNEDDLEEAFKSGFTNCYNNNNLTFGEWFEQFKKK
jgi:hypothetical protein